MYLNDDDIRKFYRIWFGILEYTNQKYEVAPNLKLVDAARPIKPADVVPVRNVLWENDSIIDEYIRKIQMALMKMKFVFYPDGKPEFLESS